MPFISRPTLLLYLLVRQAFGTLASESVWQSIAPTDDTAMCGCKTVTYTSTGTWIWSPSASLNSVGVNNHGPGIVASGSSQTSAHPIADILHTSTTTQGNWDDPAASVSATSALLESWAAWESAPPESLTPLSTSKVFSNDPWSSRTPGESQGGSPAPSGTVVSSISQV